MVLTSSSARVLVVDDDQQDRQRLAAIISDLGYLCETAADGEAALEKLDSTPFDVIISDLMMPRMDGFELLRTLFDRGDLTPAIVLTGAGSIDQAISIVHDLRAFWFLEKPARPAPLATLLERAIQHKSLVKETERLHRQLSQQGYLADLIGTSQPMREVFSLIQQIAPSSASVLITGESGTGKELVASAIHKLSPRAVRPFVALNCAALPETLIESELFGHEKGAFTGAVGRRAGCFEQANQGTLFLDEIGDMPIAMQPRLLRALQESTIRRLGATSEVSVDVRVLAATNKSLPELIQNKSFREDLFYRLNVFQIDLPPLRDRKDDILPLADAIIRDLNRKHDYRVTDVHPAALQRLQEHSWPGNVRELRNVLERSLVVAREGTLLPAHLARTFGISAPVQASPDVPLTSGNSISMEAGRPLSEVEKAYIQLTLKSTGNNKKRAAQILGISLRTLHSRVTEFAAEEDLKREGAVG
ncbi:MAG: sigma-54 dependent transcriptional regulator [Bryobacteraceae bacterium]